MRYRTVLVLASMLVVVLLQFQHNLLPGPHCTEQHRAKEVHPTYLRVPWDRYQGINKPEALQVICGSEDHRHPPLAHLLPNTRSLLFPPSATREGGGKSDDTRSRRVFQFLITIHRNYTWERPPVIFRTVELWMYKAKVDPSEEESGAKEQVVIKPEACQHLMPDAAWLRYDRGTIHMDLVARCVFDLPLDVVEQLSATEECADPPVFAIHAANDVALFPVGHVLHFPTLAGPLIRYELASPEGIAVAPWRQKAISARGGGNVMDGIVKARGKDAKVRVGAWVIKKYSWNADDELWLLWMLDVIRVDHVLIYVATTRMSLSGLGERLNAFSPEVAARVTLVALDAPPGPVTYAHLLEGMVWDSFLRWQAEFDFAFHLDTDEFPQLFSLQEPFARVDVKTFIAKNRDYMETQRQMAGPLERRRVNRRKPNKEEDPLLATVLCDLLSMNGEQHQFLSKLTQHPGSDSYGKSLFWVEGSIKPYLHFNLDVNLTLWNQREAHILHIREESFGTLGMFDILRHFGHVRGQ